MNNFRHEIKFKKTAAQAQAVKSINESAAINICLEGGSRSGKSFEIMRQVIVRASKASNSDHLICRETFNSCKRSIWLKTMPDVFKIAFPDISYEQKRSDGIYYAEMPNNSKIYISGLDDEKKLERLLGTEFSTLWINESNQVPFKAIAKLKSRLAQKNDLVKKTYYDLNPTKTSSWVYMVFHQKVNPEDGEMLPNPGDYLVIKMNPTDNLENIDKEYIKALSSLPQKERLRFLNGEYDSENSGAAVYAFNLHEHVSEEAVKLPGEDFVGSDFNIEYNSDVLGSRHGNGLNIWDEIQIAGDTYKKCDELIRKGVKGATIMPDSTGKNRSTKGKSDHIILKDAGFNVKYRTNPHVTDKIANLNRCFTLGLIKIHPRCKKLIRDLVQLQWRKDGELDQSSDPSLSHLVDALAYLCWNLYPITKIQEARIGQFA